VSNVPKIIFEAKREEIIGRLRKLHKEEFHNLRSSPNIVRVIKPSVMKWTGQAISLHQIKYERKFFI
jgi:hypothetical protein